MKEYKLEGRQMAELRINGKIQLKDGRIITAAEIQEPEAPSAAVIILHFNTIESVKMIMINNVFKKYI